MTVINSVTQNALVRARVSNVATDMGDLQRQLSTGLKAERFGEHGLSVSRSILSLRGEAIRIDQYQRSIDILNIRASRVDQSLMKIRDDTLEVRDTGLLFSTDQVRPDQIQDEARGVFYSAVDQLNVQIAGHHVFAGENAGVTPVRLASDMQTDVEAAMAAAVPPDDPAAVFTAVRDYFDDRTNWYQGGDRPDGIAIADNREIQQVTTAADQGIADTLASLATIAFADDTVFTDEDYRQLMEDATVVLATSTEDLNGLIARNGSHLSQLESHKESHDRVRLIGETELNALEQVDIYEAITRLSQLRVQLEATFRVTGQLQDLTLANFM